MLIIAMIAAITFSMSLPVASLKFAALESTKSHSSNDSVIVGSDAVGNDAKRKDFAQMMCTDFQGPKRVAVCLMGSARGFPHSLVHQSMKENLFGGSFGVEMTPFLHVTRIDARGDPSGNSDVYDEWSESQIMAAAKVLNIADEDVRIFDGPDMPLPTCSEYKHDYDERAKYEASGGNDHKNSLMYANSLAGILSHKKGCMDMIVAKEEVSGSKFDVVILSRADITYYAPLRPYCLYNIEEGRRFWDWIFMVNRDKADEMFVKPYKELYECKKAFNMGDTIEGYVFANGNVPVDLSLPVLVTRKPGARHSLCGISFSLNNSDFSKEELDRLCHDSFIDENKYNSFMSAKGESFSQMMCADFERPRQAAVCLYGSARAFPHSLVHQSMKENLFGGSLGVEMTPFLHVTRKDARGDPMGDHDVYPDWSESQIMAAAKFLNIADEDINILDGPDMPLPTCSDYQSDFKKREKYEKETTGALDHKSTLAYANALAGTISHKHGCMDLIAAKERKSGSKFDLVILSRADLTYYMPLRPYCEYNLEEGRRFWDWIFMVQRDKADEMFTEPYKAFYGCEKPFNMGDTVEGYIGSFGQVKVDLSVPVIVTRKPGAGHSLCGPTFRLDHSIFDEKELAETCHNSLIDENKYNAYLLN